MPGIFSNAFLQGIFNYSREIRLLSDAHRPILTSCETPMTSHLHLPEVCAPTQYLVDVGLQPALARQLSCTYMEFVSRYREAFEFHFGRATHSGCYLTEYYRNTFIALFKRVIQAWNSQFVSIVQVRLCKLQASFLPERVDVSVIMILNIPT